MMVFQDREPEYDSKPLSQFNDKSVAVVGGSAAGLFASALLARQGVPVRIFERIEELEPGARTLIVTRANPQGCWVPPLKAAS